MNEWHEISYLKICNNNTKYRIEASNVQQASHVHL